MTQARLTQLNARAARHNRIIGQDPNGVWHLTERVTSEHGRGEWLYGTLDDVERALDGLDRRS